MAVFTPLTNEEVRTALAHYDIGDLVALEGIQAGIENTNFRLTTSDGAWVLSVFEGRTPEDALPYVFSLISHLHDKGLPVAGPQAVHGGGFISHIKGKPAAIVAFLQGACNMAPGVDECQATGEALARMHLACTDFAKVRDNPMGIETFARYHATCPGDPDAIEVGLSNLISDEIQYLNANRPTDLPRGTIHADLFPDNVLFSGGAISGLIDFYYACSDQLIYDLAITLGCWAGNDDGSLNLKQARAMLKGYETVRRLTKAEHLAIPYFLRAGALRFLLTRTHDWLKDDAGAMVTKKDPLEYVRKLRHLRSTQIPEFS